MKFKTIKSIKEFMKSNCGTTMLMEKTFFDYTGKEEGERENKTFIIGESNNDNFQLVFPMYTSFCQYPKKDVLIYTENGFIIQYPRVRLEFKVI